MSSAIVYHPTVVVFVAGFFTRDLDHWMTTNGEYDKQYRYCHSGVTALVVLAHQRPGEFGRSSLLCGDRPSGAGFVQLADLT